MHDKYSSMLRLVVEQLHDRLLLKTKILCKNLEYGN